MSFYQEEPQSIFFSQTYHLRSDLSPSDRLRIGLSALSGASYGTITNLGLKYAISRTFVYQLRDQLQRGLLRYVSPRQKAIDGETAQKKSLRFILEHRLIGQSSIESISELMKRQGLAYSSVGYISQVLTLIGQSLPAHYTGSDGLRIGVIFASDEVFARRQPILITVDPISSAILGIDLVDQRDAEAWKTHWHALKANGLDALYVVSDEGTALEAARKASFPDQPYQPDTYHAVAHRLGLWAERLQRAAYKAIAYEYDRQAKIESAKPPATVDKRIIQYDLAQDQSQKQIQLYDDFSFLYQSIIEHLQVFDPQGKLNDPQKARDNIQCATQWLKSFPKQEIQQEARKIEQLLPNLLHFLHTAQPIVDKLTHQYPPEYLQAFCAAWQAQKNAIKAKSTKRTHFFRTLEQQALDPIKQIQSPKFPLHKKQIFDQLDLIVQSSAMVENINSILRPYLNTAKNRVSQSFLNLFMFYHNHRIYRAGKRKGYSPYQLLEDKQQQQDWVEILFHHIKTQIPQIGLHHPQQ